MKVTIRNISILNAREVADLSGQLGYNISFDSTIEQIAAIQKSNNDFACVALLDEKVIGWIHVFYTLRLECVSYCEIGGLVVDEQFRNMGIGKMLIAFIKPWCTDKKCNTLRVRSNTKRTKSHKFYEQAGFKEKKQQMVFEISLLS